VIDRITDANVTLILTSRIIRLYNHVIELFSIEKCKNLNIIHIFKFLHFLPNFREKSFLLKNCKKKKFQYGFLIVHIFWDILYTLLVDGTDVQPIPVIPSINLSPSSFSPFITVTMYEKSH